MRHCHDLATGATRGIVATALSSEIGGAIGATGIDFSD
jgi:hypothetical protein